MPLRILLADDHPMVRQHVRDILEQEGYEIACEAADGREAVQLAQLCSPDMVILDVSMPVLNGLAAAKEILRDSPQRWVILVTVHTEPGYVLRAMQAGVRGYVAKSQLPADLLAAIQTVTHGKTYISSIISQTAYSIADMAGTRGGG